MQTERPRGPLSLCRIVDLVLFLRSLSYQREASVGRGARRRGSSTVRLETPFKTPLRCSPVISLISLRVKKLELKSWTIARFQTSFETSRAIERITSPSLLLLLLLPPSILLLERKQLRANGGGGRRESFVQLNCALRNKPPRFGLRESFDLWVACRRFLSSPDNLSFIQMSNPGNNVIPRVLSREREVYFILAVDDISAGEGGGGIFT